MTSFKIVIYHKNPIKQVLYSPYHIWEHLFIKIISNYMRNDADVYGITTTIATYLYFNTNFKVSDNDFLNILNRLKKPKINKRYIENEIMIVKNEIEYLSLVSGRELNLDFRYSFNTMMNTHKKGYSWEQVKCYNLKAKLASNYDEFNNLESIILKRSKVFNNIFSLINPKMKSKYDRKNKEVLLCFCIDFNCSLTKVKEYIFSDYKLNNFLKHGFFSNISLINYIEKNNKYWLTLYTFTKIEYINYLNISLSSIMTRNNMLKITTFEYLTRTDFKFNIE